MLQSDWTLVRKLFVSGILTEQDRKVTNGCQKNDTKNLDNEVEKKWLSLSREMEAFLLPL